MEEESICEWCGNTGAFCCVDPYTEEMTGESVHVCICVDCYNESVDAI